MTQRTLVLLKPDAVQRGLATAARLDSLRRLLVALAAADD